MRGRVHECARVCVYNVCYVCLQIHIHTYTRTRYTRTPCDSLSTRSVYDFPPFRRCGSVLASSCVKPFRSKCFYLFQFE